jgi:hypothetical protein
VGHVMFEPIRQGKQILVLSLAFWSLIVMATYTANLVSFLISKRQPICPATSIAEAERLAVLICIPGSYSLTIKIKEKYSKANLVEVEAADLNTNWLVMA